MVNRKIPKLYDVPLQVSTNTIRQYRPAEAEQSSNGGEKTDARKARWDNEIGKKKNRKKEKMDRTNQEIALLEYILQYDWSKHSPHLYTIHANSLLYELRGYFRFSNCFETSEK